MRAISSFRLLRLLITLGGLVLALAHLIWPDLTIDAITVILLAVAILPWLAPVFKALEFPGGWKVEFQELQRAADKAESAGLLAPTSPITAPPRHEYAFQAVAEQDPNLALAGLRIEVERRLQALAEAKGTGSLRVGIGGLLRDLARREMLNHEERSVLADMVGLLNQAVHGATVDRRAIDWALQVGPRLLRALEQRVAEARGPGEAEALRKLRVWAASETHGGPQAIIPDHLFRSSTHGEVGVAQQERELMLRKGWIEIDDGGGVRITDAGRRAASLQ